jgi:hypothetical protein
MRLLLILLHIIGVALVMVLSTIYPMGITSMIFILIFIFYIIYFVYNKLNNFASFIKRKSKVFKIIDINININELFKVIYYLSINKLYQIEYLYKEVIIISDINLFGNGCYYLIEIIDNKIYIFEKSKYIFSNFKLSLNAQLNRLCSIIELSIKKDY